MLYPHGFCLTIYMCFLKSFKKEDNGRDLKDEWYQFVEISNGIFSPVLSMCFKYILLEH